MSYQEILELVRAGYTKTEIESMAGNSEDAARVVEDKNSVKKDEVKEVEPVNEADNLNVKEVDYKQKFNDLYNSINDLRAKLIEQNLSQTAVPGRSSESVRDIMANIIAPGGKAHD